MERDDEMPFWEKSEKKHTNGTNILADELLDVPYLRLNEKEEENLKLTILLQPSSVKDYLWENARVIIWFAEIAKHVFQQSYSIFGEINSAGYLCLCYKTEFDSKAKYGLCIGTGKLSTEILRLDGRKEHVLWRIEDFTPKIPISLVTKTCELVMSPDPNRKPIILYFLPYSEVYHEIKWGKKANEQSS